MKNAQSEIVPVRGLKYHCRRWGSTDAPLILMLHGFQDGSASWQFTIDELMGDSHSPASCPNCGISFSEFRESGRFGCSQDYTEFMTELLPLLENIHEDVEHKGKRPRSTVVGTQEQGQLIQLRNAQRNAIEEEDYETAARLRDEIAGLENSMREETPKKPRKKKKPAAPE